MPSSLTTTLLASGLIAALSERAGLALALVVVALVLEILLVVVSGIRTDDGLGP